MITISKSRLKANMLSLFRQIEQSGEEIIVTDRGRPVLRIQPLTRRESVADVFGPIQGRVTYSGDIDEPTIDEWPES